MRIAQRYWPGNPSLAEELVPALESAGLQAEADELFQATLAHFQEICQDFPQSSLHRNNLAWMSACWHGELDNALQHALRAVELERSIASYRDTLAEVFFQLGNVSEAVRHEQECLRQEPGNEHFQSQLIRFQTVLGNSVQ